MIKNEELQKMAQQYSDMYNAEIGNLDKEDGHTCDTCKNKGYVSVLVNGERVVKQCKCQNVRTMLKRAKNSGLGKILVSCTFDKFIVTSEWQRQMKEKAQSFCKDDNADWFFIGGQVGCGKSHLCCAIFGHYIKKGKEVAYMSWEEHAKQLKALANDNKYQSEIMHYKTADVLYIDDMLKTKQGEEPTKADISLAFEIINYRLINENKITIISSEKTLNEIMQYDEATASRVYQNAGDYKINIKKDREKNYRLKGGNGNI